MSFADDMARFTAKVETSSKAVFVNVCAAAKDSITDGSPLTGAPGQPVDTGNLKASWQLEFTSPTSAEITTNVDYAEAVEDGVGPHGPRAYGRERSGAKTGSVVGGSHSVKLTMAGLSRLVDDAVERVAP